MKCCEGGVGNSRIRRANETPEEADERRRQQREYI